ncbi:ion transporter [Tumidithrix elongata]|uniref:ion transporter n=1 Tax=Tumidithrix elongata TaxID=3088357 RepID=UPI0038CDA49C
MFLLREKIAYYLDDLETPIGEAITIAIALLVLLSSGIFVAQTYELPNSLRHVLDIIDNGILATFTLEYLLRFWCAEKKLKYFFSLYAIIDLVAILPFFLGVSDIKFIRILRSFRILRLIRLLSKKSLLGRFVNEDRLIFTRILFTLFAIIFVYSGLIYQIEHTSNPKGFHTFLDAFYFSVVTMTTVGFGDVIPTSQAGRLLTVLMVLTGIALIPVQLGELFKKLVKTSTQVETPCFDCGLSTHDVDAKFCKVCGAKLIPASCPIDAVKN